MHTRTALGILSLLASGSWSRIVLLVLARKIGERILIGDDIAVTVVKAGPGGVRLGIEAPPEVAVVREELADEIERQRDEVQAPKASQNQGV